MAKHTSPMRLNESLVNEAQIVAAAMSRTAAEQIEFWSELGKHVSAHLTHAQTLQLMTGTGQVVLESPPAPTLDPLSLASEVSAEGKTHALSDQLLAQGQTLYEPALEGGGLLVAHLPDGTTQKGRFVNGKFKATRKRSID